MTITPLDGGEGMGALRPSGSVPTEQTEKSVLALIRLLEKAGPDTNEHDLDCAIASWLYENAKLCGALVNYDPPLWVIRNGGWVCSLDASLALAERLVPDMRVRLDLDERPRCFLYPASIYAIGAMRSGWKQYADAPTPALALCIAVLKATSANSVGTSAASEPNTSEQST